MNLLPLLLVPTSMILIMLLLVITCWLEERLLSPRSLIVASARARSVEPEHLERFIALQSERLLAGLAEVPVQATPVKTTPVQALPVQTAAVQTAAATGS